MRSKKPSIELFLRRADARGQVLAHGLDAGALAEAAPVVEGGADH